MSKQAVGTLNTTQLQQYLSLVLRATGQAQAYLDAVGEDATERVLRQAFSQLEVWRMQRQLGASPDFGPLQGEEVLQLRLLYLGSKGLLDVEAFWGTDEAGRRALLEQAHQTQFGWFVAEGRPLEEEPPLFPW